MENVTFGIEQINEFMVQDNVLAYVDFYFVVAIDGDILIIEDIEAQQLRVFNKFQLLDSIEIKLEAY